MRKASKNSAKKAPTGSSRGKSKRSGGATARKAPRPIRVVAGFEELPDGRSIYYRKTIFDTGTVTTYGPPPPTADEGWDTPACRLMKRQDRKGNVRWTFYGDDLTLLRGDVAKGALQGRWYDPETTALVRAMESVRDHPERMQDMDGDTLRRAMLDPDAECKSAFDAARRAIHAGGLVRDDDLPRPYRIARAVVDAAKTHTRGAPASQW